MGLCLISITVAQTDGQDSLFVSLEENIKCLLIAGQGILNKFIVR